MARVCDECGKPALAVPQSEIFRVDSEKHENRVYQVAYGIKIVGQNDLPDLCRECVQGIMDATIT